jgi:hypothetical protein
MWLVALESLASLLWVVGLACAFVLSVLTVFFGGSIGIFAFGFAWGTAIAVVATIQLLVALALRHRYDHWGVRALLVGAVYPVAFWLVSASAALAQQVTALIRGPQAERMVWDIPREQISAG